MHLYKFHYATCQGIACGQIWATNRWDVELYVRAIPDYHVKNSEFVWLA